MNTFFYVVFPTVFPSYKDDYTENLENDPGTRLQYPTLREKVFIKVLGSVRDFRWKSRQQTPGRPGKYKKKHTLHYSKTDSTSLATHSIWNIITNSIMLSNRVKWKKKKKHTYNKLYVRCSRRPRVGFCPRRSLQSRFSYLREQKKNIITHERVTDAAVARLKDHRRRPSTIISCL